MSNIKQQRINEFLDYASKIYAICDYADNHQDIFTYHDFFVIPFNVEYIKSLKDNLQKGLTVNQMNMIDMIIEKFQIKWQD